MEPLVIPGQNEKISDKDFIRLVNRAQAIILILANADVSVPIKDKLWIANDTLIGAMRLKTKI